MKHPSTPLRPKITMGIELEFLVPEEDPNTNDPYPHDKRWYLQTSEATSNSSSSEQQLIHTKIRNLLRSAAIPAITDSEASEANLKALLSSRTPDTPLWLDPTIPPQYHFWTIKPDSTVFTPLDDPLATLYLWHDVELASRVFHSRAAFTSEVRRVCGVLNRSVRAAVNTTTGCHVHTALVGPGRACMTLRTVKKAVGYYVLLEKQLYGLIAPWRRGDHDGWCGRVTERAELVHHDDSTEVEDEPEEMGRYIPASVNGQTRDWIRRIWRVTSLDEVAGLLLAPGDGSVESRRLGLCLAGLKGEVTGRTLEFRMLQGSLDAELLVRWGEVVAAIVTVGGLSAAAYKRRLGWANARLAEGRRTRSRYGVPEFLRTIGIGDEGALRFWQDMVRGYEEGQGQTEFTTPPAGGVSTTSWWSTCTKTNTRTPRVVQPSCYTHSGIASKVVTLHEASDYCRSSYP